MSADAGISAERRVIGPDTDLGSRARDLLRYRELLGNLIRKELKVKYKNSALGFVWSMLNPALYLLIFWIVFEKFLGSGIPNFPIYFLSGLLAWNLLSGSLGGGVSSVVGNASLVTKVYFPREVLPLSAVGAAFVHFLLQLIVLVIALFVFRFGLSAELVVLVPSALVVLLVFLVGVCFFISVLNVYFRDVQHLLELVLLAWFWMTPIVYPIAFVQQNLGAGLLWQIYMLNPMTHIVLAFQRGIYARVSPRGPGGDVQQVLIDAPVSWYMRNLAIVALGAVVVLIGGWIVFQRLESRLAEEL